MAEFAHLHLHTAYSLLDGAIRLQDLFPAVKQHGMDSVAMTDHGNMFGAIEFYKKAKDAGVKPIFGIETYVSAGGRKDKTNRRTFHLILLAKNEEGYKNLTYLSSMAWVEGMFYHPRIDKEILRARSGGLIGLSSCLGGELAQTLTKEGKERAKEVAKEYASIFAPGDFFMELQPNGLAEQEIVNDELPRISADTGIPIVATNDCHYVRREDSRAHNILMCIQTGKTISDKGRLEHETDAYYIKTPSEMNAAFSHVPQALQSTVDIAKRCNVELKLGKSVLPRYPVPDGHDAASYMRKISGEGLDRRFAEKAGRGEKFDPDQYRERLAHELSVIEKMGFPGYFLIVWDFIAHAKEKGIPVGPGRGSGAGSLVAYAMRITDLDPIPLHLLFERFLNPERVSMPDFDVDFCMNRRGEVINYVTQKYGRENVAQIITFGTMAAKAVIKDAARAMEIPYGEADKLAKLVPPTLNITLKEALEQSPALATLTKEDPRVGQLMEVALRLEGMVRHASTHAAGVVISPQPLTDVVPLYKTNKDEIVTQYDMNGLEEIGLLKMDFLGLTTLTVVDDSLQLIASTTGEKIELDRLPFDDPATYEIFSKGLTSGVFQFESSGMRDILRRYRPTRLEDLTALNALYRPGPIQGGMVDDFIQRKHGEKPISYELPELEEILSETYGVIVYQEQVMQIANRLAGVSPGEADLLRRAMGKKKHKEMAAQRERFVQGAAEKGFPKKSVVRIFDLMEQFAGYGFNKSHSAAYAVLAYVTAYLKARYPVQFISALLTSETGNTDKVVQYINECREMGIPVLPPDIQTSFWNFTPDGKAIRFGLGAVKNVGHNIIDAILAARQRLGKFESIYQICESVDQRLLNKRVLESLIKGGALDSLGARRAQHFEVIEAAMESAQKLQRDRDSGQHGLFGGPEHVTGNHTLPDVPEWPESQILTGEKEVLGFYLTGHPLRKFEQKLRDLGTVDTARLGDLAPQTEVALGGIITSVRSARSKKGEIWASAALEDLEGSVNLLVFPEAYRRLNQLLQPEAIVYVKGRLQMEENAQPKVMVSEIAPLESVEPPKPNGVVIRVRLGSGNGSVARQLFEIFSEKSGQVPVRLELERERDFQAILEPEIRIRPDAEFVARIKKICGRDSVRLV